VRDVPEGEGLGVRDVPEGEGLGVRASGAGRLGRPPQYGDRSRRFAIPRLPLGQPREIMGSIGKEGKSLPKAALNLLG